MHRYPVRYGATIELLAVRTSQAKTVNFGNSLNTWFICQSATEVRS
jgi:hypothetical protein